MKKLSRRQFVNSVAIASTGVWLAGVSGCATITKRGNTPEIEPGAYILENNKVRIALDKVPSLQKGGGSVKILDSKLPEPIIVARTSDYGFSAVAIKCPHRGVEVEYDPSSSQFRCACIAHSTFSLDGNYIKGPAKKPLKSYPARLGILDKNKLVINIS